MNKKIFFCIIVILIIALVVALAIFTYQKLKPIYNMIKEDGGFPSFNSPDSFLKTSTSPDGKYTIDAYKTEPGATVDFSVKVYITSSDEKKLIYYCYHEREANITWISDCIVSINGKTLDLSKGETYDSRRTTWF